MLSQTQVKIHDNWYVYIACSMNINWKRSKRFWTLPGKLFTDVEHEVYINQYRKTNKDNDYL